MKVVNHGGWFYYKSDNNYDFDKDKVGKWIFYFKSIDWAKNICKKAIVDGVVDSCKHDEDSEGVICFYLNIDDFEGHKKIISWFLKNGMIKRTKKGQLTNISFKLDKQTLSGQYNKKFTAPLKLDDMVDLQSGSFIK